MMLKYSEFEFFKFSGSCLNRKIKGSNQHLCQSGASPGSNAGGGGRLVVASVTMAFGCCFSLVTSSDCTTINLAASVLQPSGWEKKRADGVGWTQMFGTPFLAHAPILVSNVLNKSVEINGNGAPALPLESVWKTNT
eukprot:1161151-Pelagomonas_calceolata.AAC.5